MSVEFRNALIGFNKDDVLNYVHKKDYELKALSSSLNKKIEELESKLSTLEDEYRSALGVVASLSAENSELKEKTAEYESKAAELEQLSEKIGKLYLVSKSTAETIVNNAEESSELILKQATESLEKIKQTQDSLKDVAENVLSASENFVSRINSLNSSLEEAKTKLDDNQRSTAVISEEFSELYAKLG